MVKCVVKLIIWNIIALCFVSGLQASPLSPFNKRFASADQAFALVTHQSENSITLQWHILNGYYLYRNQIEIEVNKATLGNYQLPPGQPYHDEFFGNIEIYTKQLELTLPLISAEHGATLSVHYQGCTEGFCYPPETVTIDLSPVNGGNSESTATGNRSFMSQADIVAPTLVDDNAPFSPLWALLLGIGIAFTPCVLPMYPLITGIILGQQQRPSNGRLLGLAFSYVQGMALTYTLLGVVVAAAGLQFQAMLQHPAVLIVLAFLFILLALSMFGVYELQLPSSLQTWFAQLSNHQTGGKLLGVFVMGAIAGLICSPCTTAPLAAILLYIAQSNNLASGAGTLYLYAFGMGIPLIIVTLFGNKVLPRSGPWMVYVKQAFGFAILAMPIFLLERLLGEIWSLRLWSLLGIALFSWLFINLLSHTAGKFRLLQIFCLIAAIICAKPLQDWVFTSPNATDNRHNSALAFKSINSVDDLQRELANAKDKIVMLDLYADWCVACKEFDKYTFTDPAVQRLLNNVVLLRADVTANNEQHKQLFEQYQILGLPGLLWFDKQGNEQRDLRISGFLNPNDFITHLQNFSLH